MFEFLSRKPRNENQPSGENQKTGADAGKPKYYQPERYYMRGPGPAWHAAHPELSPRDKQPPADENA